MKQTKIYCIIIFLALFISCVSEDHIRFSEKEVKVTVTINIPYSEQSRSNNTIIDNAVNDLALLLFDKDGHFINLFHANSVSTSGLFNVTLPESKERRVIHFVAGFDWSTISVNSFAEKSEYEIIPSLSINEGITFWSRKELLSGISEDCLSGETISLTRNRAKITIENHESRLADAWFAIYNKPDRGTVAPFNLEDLTFTLTNSNNEAVITEPAGMSYEEYDSEFLPIDGFTPSYLFERTNFGSAGNLSEQALFIIIKGKYDGASAYCYYKIELYDKETLKLLNILRNYWYKMVITEVGFKGYDTLEEALNSPASNNLTASVVLEEYPSITDKEYALIVEKTAVIFIRNEERLSLQVSYKRLIDGIEENDKISIYDYTEQNPNNPVFKTIPEFSSQTGLLTGEINDILPGTIRTAVVTIRGGDLLRKIKVSLAAPFEFENPEFTPHYVGNNAGSPTTLSFYIPGDVADYLPFNMTITAQGLSAATNKLEASMTTTGWKYTYKVEYTGRHELNFITNSPTSAEAIKMEADIFAPSYPDYKNIISDKYNFSNVQFTPQRVPFFAGNDIKLRFTTATNAPISITAKKLQLGSGQEHVIYDPLTEKFIFSPPAAGEYNIEFKTTQDNNGDTILLESNDHHTKTIILKNVPVTLSGYLTLDGDSVKYTETYDFHKTPLIWIGRKLFYNRYQTHLVYGFSEVRGSFIIETEPVWGRYATQIEGSIGDTLYLGLPRRELITPTGKDNYATAHTAIKEFIIDSSEMIINHDFHFPQ